MLYIVATPIGNLQDMTLRALDTLKEADFIICEDTRTSGKLLSHFEIKRPLVSFHAHSNDKKVEEIMARLENGEKAALITDAGTPGISDPGYVLMAACVKRGVDVVPIPGASAFLTCLMGSGLPINRFWYYGFLPAKKGRETLFKEFSESDSTIVFYESPHRILKTLQRLSEIMPDRYVVIGRELTKLHEEFVRGTLVDVVCEFQQRSKILGEFVVILAPHDWSA